MVDLPMHHNLHTSIWNVLATLNGTTIYGRPSMQNPCPHTSKSWLRHPPTSSSLSSPEITRLFLSWPQSWCNWNTQYCCTGSTLYKNTLPTSFPFASDWENRATQKVAKLAQRRYSPSFVSSTPWS